MYVSNLRKTNACLSYPVEGTTPQHYNSSRRGATLGGIERKIRLRNFLRQKFPPRETEMNGIFLLVIIVPPVKQTAVDDEHPANFMSRLHY